MCVKKLETYSKIEITGWKSKNQSCKWTCRGSPLQTTFTLVHSTQYETYTLKRVKTKWPLSCAITPTQKSALFGLKHHLLCLFSNSNLLTIIAIPSHRMLLTRSFLLFLSPLIWVISRFIPSTKSAKLADIFTASIPSACWAELGNWH